MGFSSALLLLQSSGISCVGARFGGGGGEHCSSTRSPLFGTSRPQPARVSSSAVHIGRKSISVAAVRNEFSGEEEKRKSQLLGVASASIGFNTVLLMAVTKPVLPVSPHKGAPYSWLSLPLLAVWGAIFLNAFVQYRILERLTCLPQRTSSTGRVDFTLQQRVAELEENVREFVSTARGLSKQVEKLGVRFRATKRTLRDPMQETATIAQKTYDVTFLLAQREDRLEEELRGLQRALLAMQEHQVKQLALISLALKRTQNNNNNKDEHEGQGLGTKKKLSSSVNGTSSGIKTSADTNARVGGVETPKKTKGEGGASSNSNGKSSTFSSEGSLSKIDFWKDSVTPSSAVVEKITNPSAATATDLDKTNLGSFFNGRKKVNSPPENLTLKSEVLPEEAEYVEQPDYDSDSWLR